MSQPRVSLPADWQPTGDILRDSTMALVPETLELYVTCNKSLWEDGPLSAAELELMRLRNARKVGCVYCKAVRYEEAIQAGLDEEKVQRIEDDYGDSDLNDREKLILAYTDCYLDNPAGMPQALKDRLAAEFSPQEIVHLSTALLMFNAMSRGAVTYGGMPDELPTMNISVPV